MKLIVANNYEEMSSIGAKIVADVICSVKKPTLGLATGSTPIGLYALLANMCEQKLLSFSDVTTVNLDEYVGLGADDAQSYVTFMSQNLFDKTDIDKSRTYLPNGTAADLDAECERYRELVQSHVQDIQLLGIGSNGHIGFNEPGTPFNCHTHIVDLTESTIADNSRLFDDIAQVPRRAVTMGFEEIMQAKKILVIANGKGKADAVYGMVKGEISEKCPASYLRQHPHCTLIVDREAAARIL